MKSILDPSFRYTPSFETDIRVTFARMRLEKTTQLPAKPVVRVLHIASPSRHK